MRTVITSVRKIVRPQRTYVHLRVCSCVSAYRETLKGCYVKVLVCLVITIVTIIHSRLHKHSKFIPQVLVRLHYVPMILGIP